MGFGFGEDVGYVLAVLYDHEAGEQSKSGHDRSLPRRLAGRRPIEMGYQVQEKKSHAPNDVLEKQFDVGPTARESEILPFGMAVATEKGVHQEEINDQHDDLV